MHYMGYWLIHQNYKSIFWVSFAKKGLVQSISYIYTVFSKHFCRQEGFMFYWGMGGYRSPPPNVCKCLYFLMHSFFLGGGALPFKAPICNIINILLHWLISIFILCVVGLSRTDKQRWLGVSKYGLRWWSQLLTNNKVYSWF